MLLPRPPPRGLKSLSTSKVPKSAQRLKRKESGSQSMDNESALGYHYQHYPFQREEIFRAREK